MNRKPLLHVYLLFIATFKQHQCYTALAHSLSNCKLYNAVLLQHDCMVLTVAAGMLFYVMLCYVMLCYVMLYYIMLFYVMLYYIMLFYVMLCCVILYYVMLFYVMLCYVILCYVVLCYFMLFYVMLCYVMLCYVMLCYVMLCYVMLCYVMLCYVMFKLYSSVSHWTEFLYDFARPKVLVSWGTSEFGHDAIRCVAHTALGCWRVVRRSCHRSGRTDSA